MTTNTIEEGLFLRAQDPASPNRYVLVGSNMSMSATSTAGTNPTQALDCFVYMLAKDLGTGETGPIYVAVGRVARISMVILRSQLDYVPVAKPYVLRRDDGHEITVG